MTLRVIYMGTPDFAVPALEALVASDHDVVGVVTNPDRGSGRGKKTTAPPVKVCAVMHDIEVYQPQKLRKNDEAFDKISSWQADIAVVAAYGQILPQRFLDIPKFGCINIHASLLPKYRGAAPINWCLIDGDTETGITTMQMEAGLDTGPILEQRTLAIGKMFTAQLLHDRLSAMGADMIVSTIEGVANGTIEPVEQDHDATSYARMMSKADGKIDWTESADTVANLIRGTNPWPGAHAEYNGDIIKLHLAHTSSRSGSPGEVISSDGELVIACGSGSIEIMELQAPGTRKMDIVDFLNGRTIAKKSFFS